MRRIRDRLEYDDEIGHPTLSGENIVNAGARKRRSSGSGLEDNLAHLEILDDPNCTHEQAMRAWDRVFNTDWFGGQPDPDAEKKIDAPHYGPVIKAR